MKYKIDYIQIDEIKEAASRMLQLKIKILISKYHMYNSHKRSMDEIIIKSKSIAC